MAQHPKIEWKDGTIPVSPQFDDIYFSRQDGYQESRFVFVERNRLSGPDAEALPEETPLVIGETGFGTGLNFLTAWQVLDEDAKQAGRALPQIHFQSVELYPLAPADYKTALLPRDDVLQGRGRQFCDALDDVKDAARTGDDSLFLSFDNGRVRLSVFFGDAADRIPAFEQDCHAWFLDGFTPSKNPEIWRQAVYDAMARKSRAGCRVATFTAAGFVKRGLRAAGFVIRKERGFGWKPDMLAGYLVNKDAPDGNNHV